MLTPYPGALSTEALRDMAGFFRGTIAAPVAVHAAWELVGYGLGQGFPGMQHSADVVPGVLPTGEEAAKVFDDAASHEAGPMIMLPWGLILSLAWAVIQKFLKK